jgi:hypothetical protein
MRAKDLAGPYPVARLDDDALAAARQMVEQRRPGVVILGDETTPLTVLPGSQVLRFLLPGYVQDDPSLAAVFDEKSAAEACISKLTGRTVRELLPRVDRRAEIARVDPDATVLECAALMARLRSPLLVVQEEGDGEVLGVITVAHLLEVLLADPDA